MKRTLVAATQSEWFAAWFDSEHYHRLYAHRDDAEANALVDRLAVALRIPSRASVLDLGCGSGRHARRLAALGFEVTGIDLSAESIGRAQARSVPRARFVRQDMRVPFGECRFDYVFNLFTSFGYFADPTDHLTVVRNIATALRVGGCLVLDYLNVGYAAARLVGSDRQERDGVVYQVTRWSDRSHICKRIVVQPRDGEAAIEHVERVARLSLVDFRLLFALCGLTLEAAYGSYDLAPFDERTSPRLILVARKAARSTARELPADAADGFGRHAQI